MEYVIFYLKRNKQKTVTPLNFSSFKYWQHEASWIALNDNTRCRFSRDTKWAVTFLSTSTISNKMPVATGCTAPTWLHSHMFRSELYLSINTQISIRYRYEIKEQFIPFCLFDVVACSRPCILLLPCLNLYCIPHWSTGIQNHSHQLPVMLQQVSGSTYFLW